MEKSKQKLLSWNIKGSWNINGSGVFEEQLRGSFWGK